MHAPRVSVLMPVYNGARFLQQAVDSVLQQSFEDFQFIIVDDGSEDATPEILRGCQDTRMRVIRTAHQGLIAALNQGLRCCTTQYIARMDADDLSYSDRLKLQVAYLDRHPEAALVTCPSDLLDQEGQQVGSYGPGIGRDLILELAASNQIVHGSVMLRCDMLPPAPVYQRRPEDYVLWVQLARAGRCFASVDRPLYGFRTHPARYSLVEAESQSAGTVEVQWPLLEECMATRDLGSEAVRAKLIRGWGTVACAAFRSGDADRGMCAYHRFRQLARSTRSVQLQEAILHGAEAMVWGGCPLRTQFALRLMELRLRPTAWTTYRKWLAMLRGVTRLTP